MSGEEMERAIAFVLEQQARFDGQLAELAARQTDLAERQAELAAAQTRTENGLGLMREALVGAMGLTQKVAESQIKADQRLEALEAQGDRLVTQGDTLALRMDALTAAQTETERHLTVFIAVVEKYIARNGNGAH